MKLFTIGFTGKSAERFFQLLEQAKVRTLIDTRISNKSQLAGFTKATDFPFFLRRVANIAYRHKLELAPTAEMLSAYKEHKLTWAEYASAYNNLLTSRGLGDLLAPTELEDACLLCSEHRPDQCHRRLAADFLKQRWPELEIVHLV
jgi:uncharacterized protein (DUF488 family)